MSAKMHMLKVVVSERLTQVAEEICSLVEKILLEYEQDLYRSIAPQMDVDLHLHTTTDVSLQHFTGGLVVVESCDDSPKENHNISDPEEALPRPEPSIKEEQEDEWSAGFEDHEPQAPPQRHEKDTEVIKLIYTPVCKSEQLNTEPESLPETETQHTTPPPEDAVPCTYTEPCGAAVTAVLCLPADFQTFTEPYVDAEAELAADGGARARRRRLCHCMVCKVSFSDRGALMNHAKVHADDCVRKCGICGKLQPTRECLLEHLQTHVHVCECCGKTFSRQVDLYVHVEAELAADNGATPRRRRGLCHCMVCKVSFSDRGSLMNHAKVHADDGVRKCGICGKLQPTRECLLEHLQTHVHVCECCGETFRRQVDLSVHMRCHTGQKPYTCKVCGKGFSCKINMELHKDTHTDEKPYRCSVCGKYFRIASGLIRHAGGLCRKEYTRRERPPGTETTCQSRP